MAPVRRRTAAVSRGRRATAPLTGAQADSPTGAGGSSLKTILTRGLTKRYGDVAAVDALDLDLERGVLYGFLGPNGAGKTTTIRMLLRLIFPTSGEVELLGRPMFRRTDDAAESLRRVGSMVEEPAFWNYLSGRRNLEYFARCTGLDDERHARLARVDHVLGLVGLGAAGGKKVKAYSHGMRQRLGIALALLGDPELLVLDEPTNGLDPHGMREVRTLLRSLADRGTTVFVSSHLLGEVEAMCDRVGVLARGRLVAEGPPSQLRARSDRLRIEVDDLGSARDILDRLPGVSVEEARPEASVAAGHLPQKGSLGVRLSPPSTAASVNASLVSGGVEVSVLAPESDTLEDVFLTLVEGADVPR